MPAANICLKSPQNVIRALVVDGKAILKNDTIEWHLPAGPIVDIPICPYMNLPLLHNFVCSHEEKREHGLQYANFSAFQTTEFNPVTPDKAETEASEHDCAHRCCQCVADQTSKNLSWPQKELLLWHTKLCLNMQDLQNLKPHEIKDQSDVAPSQP